VQAKIIDTQTGINDTTIIPTININPTGTFVLYGCVFQYNPNSIAGNNPHAFQLLPNSGVTVNNNLTINRVMLVRGRQPSAFTPRVETYETNSGGSENADIPISTSGAGTFDVSSPTGANPSQGRWVPSGSGIQIPTTY